MNPHDERTGAHADGPAEDALLAALRERAEPALPPVEALLARAEAEGLFARGARRAPTAPACDPRHPAPAWALAAALLLCAALATLAPGSERSNAWVPGLVQRGGELSHALLSLAGVRTP